jgi:DNA-binding transcriptional LysR family regulator
MAEFDDRAFKDFSKNILSKIAIFETACSSGSRIEAGLILGIDGSRIGKVILELEEDLKEYLHGGKLINHDGQIAVKSTDAGKRLCEFARKLRTDSIAFVNDLDALQSRADIRLVMTRSSWLSYSEELKEAYTSLSPGGSLHFGDEFYTRDRVWDDIELGVLQGQADAGIYTYPPSRDRRNQVPTELAVHRWIEEEIVLVFPVGSPHCPTGSVVSLRNLPHLEPIFHYRRALKFDRTTTIEAYLRQENVLRRYGKADWLLGLDTISDIKETLIRLKQGMSFLPWPDVKHEYESGTLLAYRLDPPIRPRWVKVAYRRDAARPALANFREAVDRLKGKRDFLPPPNREKNTT